MHNPFVNKDIGEASICVFCGSARGTDPFYVEAARELGRAIGERGFRMIFGAGNVGLMGETARAARDAGAPVIGVLPQYLRHVEPPLKSAEETIITPSIQERKQRMINLKGYFDPLRAMLDHVIEKGFASDKVLSHFRFVSSVAEAMDGVEAMLKARVRPQIV